MFPKLAKEWHPSKNRGLTPEKVTTTSKKKVWWRCSTCTHEWKAAISERSAGQGCKKCLKNEVKEKPKTKDKTIDNAKPAKPKAKPKATTKAAPTPKAKAKAKTTKKKNTA
jgi:predicted  nucleic acid-binding Zn-ribbon protein